MIAFAVGLGVICVLFVFIGYGCVGVLNWMERRADEWWEDQ